MFEGKDGRGSEHYALVTPKATEHEERKTRKQVIGKVTRVGGGGKGGKRMKRRPKERKGL